MFLGPLVAWALPARVLGWTHRGLARVRLPGDLGNLPRLGVVAGTTVLLVAAFGGLFASADAAFAHVLGALVPQLDLAEFVARAVVFAVVAVFVLFGGYLIRFPPRLDTALPGPAVAVARWEWAVPRWPRSTPCSPRL